MTVRDCHLDLLIREYYHNHKVIIYEILKKNTHGVLKFKKYCSVKT